MSAGGRLALFVVCYQLNSLASAGAATSLSIVAGIVGLCQHTHMGLPMHGASSNHCLFLVITRINILVLVAVPAFAQFMHANDCSTWL
jgi:hypothetical protein